MVPRFHPRDGETPWPACGWEDGIARVAHGVGNRVDRLKGLGNAIVPQIAEALGRMILEVK
jgi:DNA (cytosine-5)-methyltransferase 1